MKFVIGIALLVGICAVAKSEDVCHNSVINVCSPSNTLSTTGAVCDSRYGGIEHIEPEVQSYINSELTKSYEYLLLSTFFNSYQKNRPGFQKLYQGLSDRSFDNTINLIKQITRRGGIVDFNSRHESGARVQQQMHKLEVDELHSLAIALDNEKQLTTAAMHVHSRAAHGPTRDAEMSQYIEEKFLSSQAETVRKLSGYVNDLGKLMNQPDPSLAVYLFDSYLSKQ